ncbi:transposase [Amycolatopsis sp. Hca4]|uniref:transposase n=1 Tax=Amycolatopsis sp. Hca4 TaxID=2742131 RepID=UPI001592A2DD|nr:transposase [Amycolatopsis sp. Hca4]
MEHQSALSRRWEWPTAGDVGRAHSSRGSADVPPLDAASTRRSARSRSNPTDRVRGDKAYSSRAIRGHLRDRGIAAVIPEPADHVGPRKRRGSRGGRPPAVDYRGRYVVERRFNLLKQWHSLATRYDCEDDLVPPGARSDPRYDGPMVP